MYMLEIRRGLDVCCYWLFYYLKVKLLKLWVKRVLMYLEITID